MEIALLDAELWTYVTSQRKRSIVIPSTDKDDMVQKEEIVDPDDAILIFKERESRVRGKSSFHRIQKKIEVCMLG